MAEYLHLFETEEQFQEVRNGNYKEPWASYTLENEEVNYNKSEYEKLLETPLTFNIVSSGTIVWKAQNTAYTTTIEYSTDNGETWTSITSTTGGTSISVNDSDIVQFRGNNATYASNTSRYNTFGGTTASFNVKGNIMSLIDSDDFVNASSLTSSHTFNSLFRGCTGLTDASKLVLPATTLANNCYQYMFYGCASLTQAPVLPATTLASECYKYMFYGTNVLPDCSNIDFTSSSVVQSRGLDGLFAGTKVTDGDLFNILPINQETGKYCLPVTTLANFCYNGMFEGCSFLTTAPELPATTLADGCYQSMFGSCTSLAAAPELPATTLTLQCYSRMFFGCASLNYIKCLATDISASQCTNNWVRNVASSGTFVKNASMPRENWMDGYTGIPYGWTVQDA